MSKKLTAMLLVASVMAGPALAQEAAPSGGSIIMQQLLFFVPLIAIFYFLLIRPQQQRQKRHRAMLDSVKRGDTVVTSGGLIGKVTKVGEAELTVQLADGVRVQLVKGMLADVRGKGEPVAANDSKPTS